jgi:hypothetical protein
MKLNELFKKYAGQEVSMHEEDKKINFLGNSVTFTNVEPTRETLKLIDEMKEHASKNGLSLQVHWPGSMHAVYYKPDRVNVHIEKPKGGNWQISSHFYIC